MTTRKKSKVKPVVLWDVPALDIDKLLHKPDGRPSPQGVFERRIVWNLLNQLEAAGYKVGVVDSEDEVAVTSIKSAMEEIFDLDDCTIYFKGPNGSTEWVALVLGNAEDILSDYSYRPKTRTAWEHTLGAFDPEDYA